MQFFAKINMMSNTRYFNLWLIAVGFLSPKSLGLQCFKCSNEGNSNRALGCANGTLGLKDLVECDHEVEFCETNWSTPNGVSKSVGSKISRSCGNEADKSQFKDDCITIVDKEAEITQESCYCNSDGCNGLFRVKRNSSTMMSPSLGFLLFPIVILWSLAVIRF